MRNKQVEFNPYIYTLSKLYVLATKYPFFNTKYPVIILQGSLFVVTTAHVASWKNGCQKFSYVYVVAENTRSVNIKKTMVMLVYNERDKPQVPESPDARLLQTQ